LGLEGLIGKRSGSQYEAGKRTGAWVKIELHQEQEKYFGALLVGFHEGKNFKFAGRVGTGFSDRLLRCLMACRKFESKAVPFSIFRHPGATDGTRG
jgi:bifunctional non-homologous end joining protein LigD